MYGALIITQLFQVRSLPGVTEAGFPLDNPQQLSGYRSSISVGPSSNPPLTNEESKEVCFREDNFSSRCGSGCHDQLWVPL